MLYIYIFVRAFSRNQTCNDEETSSSPWHRAQSKAKEEKKREERKKKKRNASLETPALTLYPFHCQTPPSIENKQRARCVTTAQNLSRSWTHCALLCLKRKKKRNLDDYSPLSELLASGTIPSLWKSSFGKQLLLLFSFLSLNKSPPFGKSHIKASPRRRQQPTPSSPLPDSSIGLHDVGQRRRPNSKLTYDEKAVISALGAPIENRHRRTIDDSSTENRIRIRIRAFDYLCYGPRSSFRNDSAAPNGYNRHRHESRRRRHSRRIPSVPGKKAAACLVRNRNRESASARVRLSLLRAERLLFEAALAPQWDTASAPCSAKR